MATRKKATKKEATRRPQTPKTGPERTMPQFLTADGRLYDVPPPAAPTVADVVRETIAALEPARMRPAAPEVDTTIKHAKGKAGRRPKDGYMLFGEALEELADGLCITREAWRRDDHRPPRTLELIKPMQGQVIDVPMIVEWRDDEDERRGPWTPTHDDLLAGDWIVAAVAPVV